MTRFVKLWIIYASIGLVVFNLVVIFALILTGTDALEKCLTADVLKDFGSCLAEVGLAKFLLIIWPWGTILLAGALVASIVTGIVQIYRGPRHMPRVYRGDEKQPHEEQQEDAPATKSPQASRQPYRFDDDDPRFQPPER